MTEMNGKARLQAAIKCQRVDRVPISPMVHFFAARYAGITVQEFINSASASFRAIKAVFDELGGWDIIAAPVGYDPIMYALEVPIMLKLPGRDLPADEVWQADEQEVMQADDYDRIIQDGWNKYFYRYLLPRIRPGYGGNLAGMVRFGIKMSQISLSLIGPTRHYQKQRIPMLTASPATPPFEILSAARSFNAFYLDLYDRPAKVIEAMNAMLPIIIKQGIQLAKLTRIPRVSVGGTRGSGQFLSPAFFERFYFPWFRKIVEALHQKGITAILHFDSNWTKNLAYLKELPKHSCVLQLDGATDIFKAKEILRGHMCIMGDVPAHMLTFGTPDEVNAYCARLIRTVGEGGGFILGSGCEVPIDAKPKNVKAMIESVHSVPASRLW